MRKAGVGNPRLSIPSGRESAVHDSVHSITEVDDSQQFFQLNMLERGLYATFLASDTQAARYGSYFREYGVTPVLNAWNALVKDDHFRAETGSNPTKYVRSTGAPEKLQACLDIYREVRDPTWVNHQQLTRTLERHLKAFLKVAGRDALEIFRRGLEAQKNGWARGKKVDLVNLLTNDKVIRFAEMTAPAASTSAGMVYRLSLSQPDSRLPRSHSYAIRVDARRNGTVEGYVFPEGNPRAGVTTKVPAKAVATLLRDWTTYQQQHS